MRGHSGCRAVALLAWPERPEGPSGAFVKLRSKGGSRGLCELLPH